LYHNALDKPTCLRQKGVRHSLAAVIALGGWKPGQYANGARSDPVGDGTMLWGPKMAVLVGLDSRTDPSPAGHGEVALCSPNIYQETAIS
jgi:hypothetical protein